MTLCLSRWRRPIPCCGPMSASWEFAWRISAQDRRSWWFLLQGAVAYTGVIPVGGDHFTSDLSVGMCTPLAEAEKIKKMYGNAIVTLIPEGNEVEVPSVGDRPSRLLPQRLVAEILEPRARELFEMMRETLRQSGMFEACLAGMVLSGGGSRLPGIFDVAESVLRRPVRLSWPTPLAKMPATSGGTGVRHGARHGELRTAGAGGARVSRGSVGIETEGDVGGMKEQWSVVSKTGMQRGTGFTGH